MSKLQSPTLLCTAVLIVTFAFSQSALADPIGPGYDLLSTPEGGGVLNLLGMGGPEVVLLVGDPTGPGNTDTIIERFDPIDPFPVPDGAGTIDIELVELSLRSIDPVNLSGFDWDLHVDLDPSLPSIGTMTIRHEHADGGSFDSQLPVNVILTFTRVDDPNVTIAQPVQDGLQSNGPQPWSHIRPPLYPDDPQLPSGGFYPGVDPLNPTNIPGVQHTGPHPQTFPATPEPATLALLLLGGLAALRRKR